MILSRRQERWRRRDERVRGELTRLRRGIYTVRSGDLARAAAAAVRLDAVVSHESAAALWGLPTLGRVRRLHLTRGRRSQGTARYDGVKVHHAGLPSGDITMHNGVPITTVARTVSDIARARPFRSGVTVADAALRMRGCTRDELAAVLVGCRGWPGVTRARRVVDFADPRAASPLESISRVAFHDFGLPRPVLQALIGGMEYADFLWPEFRVIGEADGLDKYTAPEVLRREKLREEGFAQLGFAVLRWTWSEVYQRPDSVAHRAHVLLVRHGFRP